MSLFLVCSHCSASVSASNTSCNKAASSGCGGGTTGGAGSVSGGSVPLYPPGAVNDAAAGQNSNSSAGREISGRNAKVLYDYDAADMKELSLIADEV